jgi:hypothetical protein
MEFAARKPKSACADWRKIKGFETCVVRYAQRKRDRQVLFV